MKTYEDGIRFALEKVHTFMKEDEEESHKYEDCADIHIGIREALSDIAQTLTSELTKS